MRGAKGKLAGSTIYQSKGSTIMREIVKPTNPKTLSQMLQRAKFASLVNFFAHGKQSLFKFAFQSKRKGESDYNAFVRNNYKRIVPNTKDGIAAGHPIIGNYMMTQGSLTPLEVLYGENNAYPSLVVSALPESATAATLTVGMVSAAIKQQYTLEEGDIITIVQLSSDNTPAATVAAAIADDTYALGKARTIWDIKQFRIDSTSTELASSLGIFYLTGLAGGATALEIGNHNYAYTGTGFCYGICAIVSRNTTSGLKVSTSYLQNTAALENVLGFAEDEAWLEHVAKSYQQTQSTELPSDVILKGSLSVQ